MVTALERIGFALAIIKKGLPIFRERIVLFYPFPCWVGLARHSIFM